MEALTPIQVAALKADMVTGPLKGQIAPLLALGPVVDTLYDFPAGTLQPDKTLPLFGQNVVTYTINGVVRTFVGLHPVPDDVYAAMSDADKATLLVSHVQHSQDATIAGLYNVDFVTAFLPYLKAALAKDAVYYGAMWSAILAMPTIDFTHANVSGALSQAVSDGVLTPAQAAAINQRTGTYAEVLCGAETVASWQMIQAALAE